MNLNRYPHYQRKEGNIAGSFESEEVPVGGPEQEDKRELKKKIATKNEKQDGIKYKISGVFL